MIAKAENEKLLKTFNMVEWIMHTAVTIVFTIAAITIVPFVSVYTKDISDVNYIVPAFGSLLVLAYAALCLRIPYFRVIKAAGHFKQTQNGAYISALLNVVLSLLLVFKYGLVGTAIGTLVAMAYHTCYFVAYLRKNILVRSIHYFMKYVLVDGLIAALSIYLTHNISMQEISYPAWVIYAIKVFGITIGISLIVNILCHRQNIKEVFVTLKVLKK